jgi:hypothetical protein
LRLMLIKSQLVPLMEPRGRLLGTDLARVPSPLRGWQIQWLALINSDYPFVKDYSHNIRDRHQSDPTAPHPPITE